MGDADADDVVQETLVTCAQKGFSSDAPPAPALLFGVARNHARHLERARRRRARLAARAPAPDSVRSPESLAEAAELRRAIDAALDELPGPQREALVACAVHELSSAEAGAMLRAPEATIRTRIWSARRHLQRRLGLALVAALLLLAALAAAYVARRGGAGPTPPRAPAGAPARAPGALGEARVLEVAPRALRPSPAPLRVGPGPGPARSTPELDADERAYRAALAEASAGSAAWDRYLAAFPRGRFAPEARWSRAVALASEGRSMEARTALETFASEPNGYRAAEARRLLER